MKCPVDNTELLMSDRQGIEIDYCPQCRGVWLDRGELDKIIERSTDFPPRETSTYREERYEPHRYEKDDDYYKRRKRKSFLGELFDFD